jgi:phosphate transport system substrate-binding protein
LPGGQARTTIEIDSDGSSTGFEDLSQGKCDLAMASRPVADGEARRVREAGHGDMRAAGNENVIALDGIAVIVNGQNAVTSMSLRDLAKIYTGETATWPASDVVTGPIVPYARDERSGTFEAFRSVVLGDGVVASWTKRAPTNREVTDAVSSDPRAIGFVAMTSIRSAKVVAISDNGAAALLPTAFTVGTEDYPLTRRLYLYAPVPRLHPLSQRFVSFVLSPDGQAVVTSAGFVDMSPKTEAAGCTKTCPPAYVAATGGARRLSFDFRFQPGGTSLDSRGQEDIPRLVGYLAAHPAARVLLLGFADSNGPPETNLRVSDARAQGVRQALAERGVHADDALAFGEQMPVATNTTPAGRERNRRVEVWVKGEP